MTDALKSRCSKLLAELGLIDQSELIQVTPLSGGVGSDIARVNTSSGTYCVKFALPKLKVEADWFAPVHRNAAEYAWLTVASKVSPKDALKLCGHSHAMQGFAMEFLEGDDTFLWKSNLLSEAEDNGEAGKVGKLLGRIHQSSSSQHFDRSLFKNRDDFHALRIEPYLLYTSTIQNSVATSLESLAETLDRSEQVLVHGDVSPKNIFFRSNQPIILDAECATIGDASFDPAFCLNHLVLKALHLPFSKYRYLKSAQSFWDNYSRFIDWEPKAETEARVCALLPALMLGRVDGKSPVEYLTDAQRQSVRQIALHFIKSPKHQLSELLAGIQNFSKDDAS